MTPPADEQAIERLELLVGRLLQAGVWLSAACLATGLALWMTLGSGRLPDTLLTTGLVVLMLTPLARVVASLVAYIRLRDWFFAATTVMVFVVLVAAWLLKS
jgi:uncharacterized membrane protein